MGLSIVQQVINQLISNGIPAIRGYPARKAPALPEVQAAVSLKGTERNRGTVEVLVSVCGPTSFGGGICEDTAQKACRVLVPDDQLSLAIGKEGQNARLAARLTGFKIDIKPVSQAE